MDQEINRQVLEALERHGVTYVVFGGVALNLHGLARFTQDLDVFLLPDVDNVARLKDALTDVFHDPSIAEISAADLLGDYPAVQYVPPDGEFHIDILTRLGQVFAFGDVESERVPYQGLSVPVATPRMLYRMKKDTVRLKDRADAEALRQRFRFEGE